MLVGIYTRVSTQEQVNEGYSIGEQLQRITKYCEAMRWDIYKSYTDPGFSGASMERPALQDLISDVVAGKIDKIIVYKLDRLSRSQLDTLYLIEKVFLYHNTDFISISENFDTSSPFGRAMIGILAVFAQLEREQIKERMTMGKEARVKAGKWTGGINPFGYDYIDGQLKINDYEALQVRELFSEVASGKPLLRICEDFNEKGYRLRKNSWSMWSIKYILENRVYIGYIRHNNEWIKGIHTPIIDDKTFFTVGKILDENRKRFIEAGIPAGGKHRSTYLGGLIRCAHCGGKYGKRLSGNPRGQRYYTYVCYSRMKKVRTMIKDPTCKNKIYKVDELDKIIFDEIKKLALDPDYFNNVSKTPKNPDNKNKLRLIESELINIDNQISRLIDLYSLGRFSVEQLDNKISDLDKQKQRLQIELKSLSNNRPALSTDEAFNIIQSFGEIIENGEFYEVRAMIEALIDKIVIDNDNINIYWRFN